MELVAGGATGPTDEGAGALGLPRLTAAHRVRRELVQPGCERHRQPADNPEQRQRQRDADHGEARPVVTPGGHPYLQGGRRAPEPGVRFAAAFPFVLVIRETPRKRRERRQLRKREAVERWGPITEPRSPGRPDFGVHSHRLRALTDSVEDRGGGCDQPCFQGVEYGFDESRVQGFYDSIRRYYPGLKQGALQPGFTGVRPKTSPPGSPASDFQIQGSSGHGVPGLVNLYGIESPGLTASLALAEQVRAAAGA